MVLLHVLLLVSGPLFQPVPPIFPHFPPFFLFSHFSPGALPGALRSPLAGRFCSLILILVKKKISVMAPKGRPWQTSHSCHNLAHVPREASASYVLFRE